MNPLIIIPTLNEAHSIEELLIKIWRTNLQFTILVVDGNSTDGTDKIVLKMAEVYPNIILIRQEEPGFGEALRVGFKKAIEENYDPVITMDADHSHDPVYLSKFMQLNMDHDLIIGSRYINGVRVEGWKFRNLLISKLANMYISYILVKPIWDFTSGYRCYRKHYLESINLDQLKSEAYIIQIQLLHLAYQKKMRVKEIPFVYRDTREGQSKISKHTKRKTFMYVLKCRAPLLEILRHLTYVKKDYKRFIAEYEELVTPPKLKNNGVFHDKDHFSASIGVMAYNEEKIIGKCLDRLLEQKLQSGSISEIVVVSSGSTDNTNKIVSEYAEKDPRIKLLMQEARLGKASAINEYLRVARGDIIILESADTITQTDTVEELIKPFKDRKIGMTGAHPVPVNDENGFIGFCVHKLWQLHHQMALQNPKCGEMVAFRNLITKIPNYTAVDEAAIEGILLREGFRLAYAEKALINNKGPENFRDFVKQRRRIASGHRHLYAAMQHEVSTQNPSRILKYVLKYQKWSPKEILYMFFLVVIEGYARTMGMIDYYLKDKNPFIWDISKSTKIM
jgi:glycosyltransferase involved in cell wall biosynthesis